MSVIRLESCSELAREIASPRLVSRSGIHLCVNEMSFWLTFQYADPVESVPAFHAPRINRGFNLQRRLRALYRNGRLIRIREKPLGLPFVCRKLLECLLKA